MTPLAAAAHPARWWHGLPDGRLQCDLCPRECHLGEGQRGACFVRQNQGGSLVLTAYGRTSGFGLDPIEKKPLYHFLPGSTTLSFGTVGCNLLCKFCQNWDISRSQNQDRLQEQASPEAIAATAEASGCRSVAFTYNDPVVFAEYALDAAAACHDRGLHTVAVTAGYVQPEARRAFFAQMDAANVDLKAFTEGFYARLCSAHLQPVLDTLRYLRQETGIWLELTTLLIPDQNDGLGEVAALADWIARELGPEVPLHFTAFHPAFRMNDLPATPAATLTRARDIARAAGLQFVYTGNVRDPLGSATACPDCQAPLILREGYHTQVAGLTPEGCCQACGRRIPGVFEPAPT
jgi:pyruvate formate lyase activating enzyme